jgi:hypothetical protein
MDDLECLFVNGILNVKRSVKVIIEFIWLRIGNTGCCEHDNEPYGCIKGIGGC